ncbi:MAG: hypothetical protein AUG51_19400 [Acidobacteria bacterium 13_1_20CM_3_53_8]|nr:MAG: hypothetical protein AUG51_19400 [Acidobacteria bacterium 13_1_20CM_3_53_8]
MRDENNIRGGKVCSIEGWRRAALSNKQTVTLLSAGSSFKIKVHDDSMKDEGIRAGDLIDCERADSLASGELGLMRTPYGVMVRRFLIVGCVVCLEAANAEYPKLCMDCCDVEILGRLLKLERRFDESEVA